MKDDKILVMEELNEFLGKYLVFLKKIVDENKNKQFNLFERTFLDFVSRNKNNINGIDVLLKEFVHNEFIIVPIASVMRTITADGLTIAYLSTFFTDDLKEEQNTINNEIKSLHLEILRTRKEISKIERPDENLSFDKEGDYYNFENEDLKSKKDLHKTSKAYLIEGDFKLPNGNLSEKSKYDRVNLLLDFESKIDAKYCYLANKYFSQYYHYSPLGGLISRTKNQEILEFDIQQIKVGLVATFFILTNILEKINFIKNEDILELKSLANNLARDKS